MSSEALYTIIYPFMSSVLGLAGYEKEAFAVIFNFWIKAGETPIRASLTIIQKITGGTRPAITRAIAALVKKHLVIADKRPGKTTMYSVTISPELLANFKNIYKPWLVKSITQQEVNSITTTGSVTKPLNKIKGKIKTDTTLRVRQKDQIYTGGLPEAK